MKRIIGVWILCLVLITGFTGVTFSQNIVMEHNLALSEEQKDLWLAYGVNPNLIAGVWVYKFHGTSEEALMFIEESLKRDELEMPEMHLSEDNLDNTINNTISWFGDQMTAAMGQEWIGLAQQKADEYKDVNQKSYIGVVESKGSKTQINIDSPFFSPMSLEVYEGTYVTYTEYLEEKEDETEKIFGEEISLINKLPEEYLQGEWTLKERELNSKYDSQVPELLITIGNLIGSVEETEIEAERFLFAGQFNINDQVYEAYNKLDLEKMYAYPMAIISILKEEGNDYILEILFEDIDNDIQLYITSDFKEVYEKGMRINMNYSHDGDNLDTEFDNELDYLIMK